MFYSLLEMVRQQKAGASVGIYSCCSANEYVIRAAIQKAKELGRPVLIEATANQVNQDGGYTGMKPEDFYRFVKRIADEYQLAEGQLILGGDHLGPLTWVDLDETEAMSKAEQLVYNYAKAGFTKIHLDTSMRLASDDRNARLTDDVISRRGARLCACAEQGWRERCKEYGDCQAPVYVIGSEVPIPGGAQEAEDSDSISVTRADDCMATYRSFQQAFESEGLHDAWSRVIGMVVQPGVEFGDKEVFQYQREKAAQLISVLKELPIVFEGHSTDYQTAESLRSMVEDGIAILKVGPALTFALREALFALENIEKELYSGTGLHLSNFRAVLETAMLKEPKSWEKYFHEDAAELRFSRAYSFSDRTRYYLPKAEVNAAVERLMMNLAASDIPLSLISQYMPMQYRRVRAGLIDHSPLSLVLDRIGDCINTYEYATGAIAWL